MDCSTYENQPKPSMQPLQSASLLPTLLTLPKAHMTNMHSVVDDFSNLLTEAESLLKQAGNEGSEKARVLQTEVEAKLLDAKLRLQEIEGKAVDGAKAVKAATETYVQQNPWQTIGIAAAVGFLAGVLVSRR